MLQISDLCIENMLFLAAGVVSILRSLTYGETNIIAFLSSSISALSCVIVNKLLNINIHIT